MNAKRLPEDFEYLKEMYHDAYFPNFLVDKLKDVIKVTVKFIEETNHTKEEIQKALDQMTLKTNELQEEFDQNGSEIESVARDSIALTVENILKYFDIDIDIEEAIREREW
jgi:predicted DNA-binding ArsR family transcriptional regulator